MTLHDRLELYRQRIMEIYDWAESMGIYNTKERHYATKERRREAFEECWR